MTTPGHWHREPAPVQRLAVAHPPAVPPSAAQEELDEEEDNKGLRSWALRSPARGRRGRRSSAHPPTCPPSAAQEHRAAGPPARSRQPAPWCAAAPAPVRPAAPPGWLAASPVEESSVPVGQRTSRTPPPLSAPPPAERCDGGPLPARTNPVWFQNTFPDETTDDDHHDHDVDTPSVGSAFFCCVSSQSMEASGGTLRVSCGQMRVSCGKGCISCKISRGQTPLRVFWGCAKRSPRAPEPNHGGAFFFLNPPYMTYATIFAKMTCHLPTHFAFKKITCHLALDIV